MNTSKLKQYIKDRYTDEELMQIYDDGINRMKRKLEMLYACEGTDREIKDTLFRIDWYKKNINSLKQRKDQQ